MLVGRLVLLQMCLGMGQMTCSRGVATSDGALLEMTFKDIGSGEGVAAKDTHIWAVTSVLKRKLARYNDNNEERLMLLGLRLKRWRFKCFA